VAEWAARALRRFGPRVERAVAQARCDRFALQLRAQAALAGATVEVDVAPDVRIGRAPRITVQPGTHSVVRLGPGAQLGDHVTLQLKGGTLEVGPRSEVRHRCLINLAGTFVLAGDNVLSWGCVVHCSTLVRVDRDTIIGEYTTIADSNHYFTTPDAPVWHNVRRGQVVVGRNTWICAKATLGAGADIGAHCIIGSNTVVTDVVPDGHLASGVPAVVRPLALPWRASGGD
jgi:acetyltransferase-like isoleucine patch superfamily enzyme